MQHFLASEYSPVEPEQAGFHIIPVPLEQSVSYTAPPHTNMGHAGPAFAAP